MHVIVRSINIVNYHQNCLKYACFCLSTFSVCLAVTFFINIIIIIIIFSAQAQSQTAQQAITNTPGCKCHPLLNRYVILGLILWATVVTWASLTLGICIICAWRKSKSMNSDVTGHSGDPAWINAVKTEEYHTYPQDTIQR